MQCSGCSGVQCSGVPRREQVVAIPVAVGTSGAACPVRVIRVVSGGGEVDCVDRGTVAPQDEGGGGRRAEWHVFFCRLEDLDRNSETQCNFR